MKRFPLNPAVGPTPVTPPLDSLGKTETTTCTSGESRFKTTSRVAVTVSLIGSLFFLTGCFDNKAQSGAGIGALGGGLAGSLLGPSKNKEQNALIGAVLGGLIGYTVGNEMDKADRQMVNQAFESKPSYETAEWVNPDTGNAYAVTPRPARQIGTQNCREAEIESVIDGKRETVVTTACRQPNGQWKIQ
ncbi:MAG: glycine zipper 2TM domain-containing protein [Magnetococcales bacterium]|nr:glycine zipper 2TM domain-containing protein [Magnetococcales bacterium]